MLDLSKNYGGADLGIKTKYLEADTIAGDIHAGPGTIGATELASDAVETAKVKNGAVTYAKTDIVVAPVVIALGATTGTATVTTGSNVIGFRPVAVDQVIKNINVTGTTLTVELNANATAENTVNVLLMV